MQALPQPDNNIYLGRGGSGKTVLAFRHVVESGARRVLVVCPIEDQAQSMRRQLGNALITSDPVELVHAVNHRGFCVIFTPRALAVDGWQFASKAAYAAGDVALVWDEAGLMMGAQPLRGPARDCWMAGRHRRLRIYATSQRPATVSRDCTANVTRVVIFHTSEPNDLAWYRQLGPSVPKREIESLNFAAHEAIDWRPSGWRKRKAPFR